MAVDTVLNGMAVTVRKNLLEEFLDKIADDPDIAFVEPDVRGDRPAERCTKLAASTQLIPWGVEAVGGTRK